MRQRQTNRDQRDPAVKVVDDVFAPRLGDVAEAGRETELQAHHRQAGVADGDRELRPEIARGRQRSRQEREQRAEDKEEVQRGPNGSTHDKADSRARRSSQGPRSRGRALLHDTTRDAAAPTAERLRLIREVVAAFVNHHRVSGEIRDLEPRRRQLLFGHTVLVHDEDR